MITMQIDRNIAEIFGFQIARIAIGRIAKKPQNSNNVDSMRSLELRVKLAASPKKNTAMPYTIPMDRME